MENHRMTHNLFQKRILFNCSNAIESLRCVRCTNFETHKLVNLKRHFKAGHTLPPESEEKLHECGSCTFQTHSEYLHLGHEFFNLCTRDKKVKSETTISELQSKELNETDRSIVDPSTDQRLTSSLLGNHIASKHLRSEGMKCETALLDHNYCSYKTPSNQGHLKGSCKTWHKRSADYKMLFFAKKNTDSCKNTWLECQYCSYRSKKKSYIQYHIDCKHSNEATFKCDHCQLEVKSKGGLQYHVLMKHTDTQNHILMKQGVPEVRWFECQHSFCNYKTKEKSVLKQHIKYDHGKKDFLECDYCPHVAKYKSEMKYHLLRKHTLPASTEWFDCEQCWYTTTIKRYLQAHIYLHERRFQTTLGGRLVEGLSRTLNQSEQGRKRVIKFIS